MKITADMVKELRGRTGSGMMECKKSLVEANGDKELAIANMRKLGLAKADKKLDRIAAEGLVGVKISQNGKSAVLVEINSETDFVVKGDEFQNFFNTVTDALLNNTTEDQNQIGNIILTNGESIEISRRALVAKVGENITVRRFKKFTNVKGGIGCYLHAGKIATIVELSKDDSRLGKDIAMHIVAKNPICLTTTQVSEELIKKEKDIFVAQALKSGKKPEIIDKMISGRIKKFLSQVTLEGQLFIKDDRVTVAQLVKSKDNSIVRFVRFEVGEGIEKQEVDFAKEVISQARS